MSKKKVTGQPNSYTSEFKESAINLAIKSDQPRAVTARELGINVNTLHTWVSKYQESHNSSGQTDQVHLYDELRGLRKENKRLREERDILKKAAAYFASHQS